MGRLIDSKKETLWLPRRVPVTDRASQQASSRRDGRSEMRLQLLICERRRYTSTRACSTLCTRAIHSGHLMGELDLPLLEVQ